MKTLRVKVKPNARLSSLEGPTMNGLWLARVKSPPTDGKANRELIALIAEHFSCPRAAVTIKSGAAGRIKLVQIKES